MWILILFGAFLILWGPFILIDSVGLKEKQGEGIVIKKWLEPAHTTTTYVLVGKIMVPQEHFHDNAWKAKIKINDITDDVSFCESDWKKLTINQKFNCTYKNSRICNSLYIEKVLW